MMYTKKYDIIFAGAGLSALSLATRIVKMPFFQGKKILLLDRDKKEKNDRTWCFWATPAELETMPPVITRSWPNLHFYSDPFSALLDTGDYQYHMVRGAGFYEWAKKELAQCPTVTWLHTDIQNIAQEGGVVHTADGVFQADWVLNSAFTPVSLLPELDKDHFQTPFSVISSPVPPQYIYLLQHFKGWLVRTTEPAFDPSTVTIMDFRVEQSGHTRFVYVLPLSTTEALVEYTVFSPQLLPDAEYNTALKQYLQNFLNIQTYEIIETEFGVIPMTDYPFSPAKSGRVINIGTAGGFVKGSSGYAFKRTQRRTAAFAQTWATTGQPDTTVLQSPWRFRAYDTVFLRALSDGLVPAHMVFSSFFKKLGGKAVFQFLDEDSNFLADFRALNAVPTLPFVRAAMRQGLRLPYV